jgi:hypothetical protein
MMTAKRRIWRMTMKRKTWRMTIKRKIGRMVAIERAQLGLAVGSS